MRFSLTYRMIFSAWYPYCLINKLRPCHVPTAINNRPPATVVDAANEAHHGIDINNPWCHLRGFCIIGDVQRSLVFGFPRTDDGEDNGCWFVDRWDGSGWYLYGQNLVELPEVLGGHKHRFSSRYVFINVSEQRVLLRL